MDAKIRNCQNAAQSFCTDNYAWLVDRLRANSPKREVLPDGGAT